MTYDIQLREEAGLVWTCCPSKYNAWYENIVGARYDMPRGLREGAHWLTDS